LYTVESLIDFDTSAVGTRKMRLRIKMKDGLASKDFDIDYQVKWGSTFVLKGLDNATVGAFSLLKENNQWALHASPGISDADLSKPVNNYFGRNTYYGIEVIENVTTKHQYEVPGNISIKEAIEGFNNGQPLNVEKGNVIKVYHAESSGKNLLMVDELVKDFTIGSDYAYYEVTDHGLEPILAIDTDTKPQEFQLGEDTSKVDGTQLINHLTINGTEVPANLYTVKQLADFDTQTVGDKELRIQIETKDGNISKEIGVPYEVKWGNSIVMKSSTGGSAGVYSLQPGSSNTSRRLKIHQGFDSPLDEKLGQDPGLYYSLTVLRDNREVYAQDMPGHATLQQIMTAFGTDQVVSIQLGDVVKVYHPQRSEGSSVLMVDEKEEDFTYGSPYAYYQVTAYGFEPMSVMEAHTANQAFVLGEDISQIEDSQLLEKVTINGETVPEDAYTIERLSALDTTTIGKKTVKMKVRMNDGLSVVETEIPYEVKWGSTFVLKGLEEATVGAFSILKQNETLAIYASKGETTTDMDAPVNYTFGRDTYYKIEVLADPKKKQLFPDNIKYSYEVAGNRTVRQAIQGFNNGQPLVVEEGDIFKVYHAETENRNLLMRDDLVKDYTAGLNYAYYQVKNDEFEPITMLEAEVSSQELILGEDASKLDAATLLENVSFNGQKLANTLYKVEQTEAFDTHTTGQKTVNLKVTTADGVSSTDIEVPYEVKWGSTIHLKNRKGETVGSFGLLKNEKQKQIEIQSMQGSDQTVLKNRVTELDDMNVYYGIEVLTSANVSKYKYEVRGTQTIEQAISRFNSGKGLIVNEGDVIRVFHSDSNNNLLMSEERERNFTYGGKYAIYKVTEYGFEPSGELTVTPHTVKIVQGAKKVDLKSLVKEVKVNGKNVPSNFYNVTLSEEVEEIDTSKLGENSIPIDVTVDPTFGGFTTQTQTTYEVVEEGTEGAQGPEN
ncbi:cell wall protein, partial [Enterococcus hirae]